MDETEFKREYLISKSLKYITYGVDDLKSFRACLNWACIDQSSIWKTALSCSLFFLFGIGVPIVSHFVLVCSGCDENHEQPYDAIVELSISGIAALSYLSLVSYARRYGLRRFLFLDKLCDENEKVKLGYTAQLQTSLKIICMFVVPIFLGDTAYKIWWYVTGGSNIAHLGNIYVSHTIACILEQCSWIYRTSLYYLTCVLYCDICYLQSLRLDDFAKVFQEECDAGSVLVMHLKLRRTLRIISHRFRLFLLWTLLLVTASQLASLLVTTKSDSDVNISTAGELALCSITLVTGLGICLRSATKITHKAQAITNVAAKWHVCATIDSFDNEDNDTPLAQQITPQRVFPVNGFVESDSEETDGDDELDNTKMVPTFANTISYQKRQALVTYLENNKAGITVYGFMLDRTYLNTIFGVELSLVLWLLSKTVGIS